ncbi:hypothetical protein [Shewanella woodyi]|nr:hypothetical protein [Shewanella woodyi]
MSLTLFEGDSHTVAFFYATLSYDLSRLVNAEDAQMSPLPQH